MNFRTLAQIPVMSLALQGCTTIDEPLAESPSCSIQTYQSFENAFACLASIDTPFYNGIVPGHIVHESTWRHDDSYSIDIGLPENCRPNALYRWTSSTNGLTAEQQALTCAQALNSLVSSNLFSAKPDAQRSWQFTIEGPVFHEQGLEYLKKLEDIQVSSAKIRTNKRKDDDHVFRAMTGLGSLAVSIMVLTAFAMDSSYAKLYSRFLNTLRNNTYKNRSYPMKVLMQLSDIHESEVLYVLDRAIREGYLSAKDHEGIVHRKFTHQDSIKKLLDLSVCVQRIPDEKDTMLY